MKKLLKPSYYVTTFKAKGILERGEIYVCDNSRDIVIQVVFKDVTNGIEPHINILKNVVTDYINSQSIK